MKGAAQPSSDQQIRIIGSANHQTSGSLDQRIIGSADHWTSGSLDQRIIKAADHRTSGSLDQRIIGLGDHRTSDCCWISGSSNQRISDSTNHIESADHHTSRSLDQRIIGSADHRTSGSLDQRIIGAADQWISGSSDQRITGPADRWISGSLESSQAKRLVSRQVPRIFWNAPCAMTWTLLMRRPLREAFCLAMSFSNLANASSSIARDMSAARRTAGCSGMKQIYFTLEATAASCRANSNLFNTSPLWKTQAGHLPTRPKKVGPRSNALLASLTATAEARAK